MTRLVFVHGMKNEDQDPDELRAHWHDSLKEGWRRQGLSPPEHYEVELPYYGQVLHDLTDGAEDGLGARNRGPQDIGAGIGEFQAEYYRLLQEQFAISDEQVRAELDGSVRERGPANWEWVQAIARVIERRSTTISDFALQNVPQVDGYLDRPSVRRAVDEIVEPTLTKGRTVLVAHSLGTIVSYLLLKRQSGNLDIPLFLTLGSPLGITVINRKIRPIILPESIWSWINGVDERDYVALRSKLVPPAFPNMIININDIDNQGDDKHAISEYLKDPRIAREIARALSSN